MGSGRSRVQEPPPPMVENFVIHAKAVKDGHEIHEKVPDGMKKAMKTLWPKLKETNVQKAYDIILQTDDVIAWNSLDLEFFAWMHRARLKRLNHEPVDYDSAFTTKFFKNGVGGSATLNSDKVGMDQLARNHADWDAWVACEKFSISQFLHGFITRLDIPELDKLTGSKAMRSYDNKLDFDAYYDDYDSAHAQQQFVGGYNGYKAYDQNAYFKPNGDYYYGGHGGNVIQHGDYGDAYMYGLMVVGVGVFLFVMTILCCVFGAIFGFLGSVVMGKIKENNVENDKKRYSQIHVEE